MKKMAVVWVCNFSNSVVHKKLKLKIGLMRKLLYRLIRKSVSIEVPEFAVWISNGINEIEKFKEIELHVVSPYPNLKGSFQEFQINGIYYHFFHNEDDFIWVKLFKKIFNSSFYRYRNNRHKIKKIISKIQPDIVHLFGAENPYYSLSILDVPHKIPTIAQLQTLLCDPDFKKNYPISDGVYRFRSSVEKNIIKNVGYVGTTAEKYIKIIKANVFPEAVIINTSLALAEPVYQGSEEKQFDFVYFAANINKAADLAFEAFGRVFQRYPQVTLDVIGQCDKSFKVQLDEIIMHYNMSDAVFFEGRMKTHEDLLCQIRKSRFALLPLKIDLTSSTIREAMANGLPVVTTDTGELGTKKLNSKTQNVLISSIGDHQALADNMIRLLNDNVLSENLRQNAYQLRMEANSNKKVVEKYIEAYKACVDNCLNGTPLPDTLVHVG